MLGQTGLCRSSFCAVTAAALAATRQRAVTLPARRLLHLGQHLWFDLPQGWLSVVLRSSASSCSFTPFLALYFLSLNSMANGWQRDSPERCQSASVTLAH